MGSSKLKNLMRVLVLVVAGFGAQGAWAVLISSTSDTIEVNWLLQTGEVDNGGNTNVSVDLTASALITVDAFSATSATLNISITNTIDPMLGVNDSILAFGFFASPETSVTAFIGGSTFDEVAEDTNFPSFKDIDVCIFAQNCTGGDIKKGLAPGESDFVTLTLAGDFAEGLDLDPFAIKFQGENGSYEFSTTVPEPGTLALFGVGLIALTAARSRRRRF